ncbi:glycerate kinase type-2 family protein [Inquilinus limosus]|uniref:glycerate kinase type-2 family protein n=1 Tax=Inquilinus limosus TaxID=171674 RepID=UPI000408AC39|nr:glycerate kinase [Inquilinus limosus]
MSASDRAVLEALFQAALGAAYPETRMRHLLPEPPTGRTIVLGAGKGAARMARAFETLWPHPCEGLVVTRYGHGTPTERIEVVEAAHPVPDAAGRAAARRILDLARAAGPDDLVVFLISGGASALLSLPAEGLTLEDKQAINKALLRSGAPIQEMNAVRKAMSAIKGGRLAAAAAPARAVTYLISDVPGDEPGVIGSGPTVVGGADPETALAILRRYDIPVSDTVERAIRANAAPAELPPGQDLHMLATPQMALEAAAAKARELGLTPLILGDALEGEAREVGRVLAGIAEQASRHDQPAPRPCVLLSGGETTVTVRGQGRGGRNVEFLLALAIQLQDRPGIAAIACDTDGIDGSEDNAGAWIDAATLAQGREKGLSAPEYLANNDAYSYFAALDRLVVTGPTLTNVNDFRAILVR